MPLVDTLLNEAEGAVLEQLRQAKHQLTAMTTKTSQVRAFAGQVLACSAQARCFTSRFSTALRRALHACAPPRSATSSSLCWTMTMTCGACTSAPRRRSALQRMRQPRT